MAELTKETLESRLKNPRSRVYLPEMLKHVSKLKSEDEKVQALRSYANKDAEHMTGMKDLMQCLFHPAVVYDLPEGDPPFKVDYIDYDMAPLTLAKALKKSKYFVKGTESFVQNPVKREQIFMQTLESLFIEDAKLFLMVKDKKIDQRVYKGVTEDLFRAAFAGWLPPKENPTKES